MQAFIIAYLHEKMPGVFGNKRKEKEKLINNLASIFQELFHFIAISVWSTVDHQPLVSTQIKTSSWNKPKELSKTHGISIGDFPDVAKMQEQLREADFSKFKAIHKNTLEKVAPFIIFAQQIFNSYRSMLCWAKKFQNWWKC